VKKIIKGGTVVSLAPDRPQSELIDILIDGDKIVEMAPAIVAADAEVIDVSGQIVMPGFVDTHRHSWQTAIRGVAADWSLLDYVRNIRMGYARAYRPQDVKISLLVGILEAIDTGITSMCDYCHIINSPEHADAALEAFAQTGIRGQLSYGFYDVPLAEPRFRSHGERLDDAIRVADTFARGSYGKMSLGVALTEAGLVTAEQTRSEIEMARTRGLRMTAHMGTLSTPDAVGRLDAAGLLGSDILHVHCNFSSDAELVRIRDTGGAVSVTPETELQMGMGFPITGRLLALGMRPTLGIDIVSDYSGDMFMQMRFALQVERALRNEPFLLERKMPATISPTVLDALRFATTNGAEALDLHRHTGHLAPGMAADLITLRTDGMHYMPPAKPVAGIVLQSRAGDVDNVMIAGTFKKRHGKLLGWDIAKMRKEISASQQYITTQFERSSAISTQTTSAYAQAIKQIVKDQ
jgi:5-methylthioadenosine/S-adenosylhomocysteine deaminase